MRAFHNRALACAEAQRISAGMEQEKPQQAVTEEERRATLPAAAQRALAEADARREKAQPKALPTELGGRDGPEPVRYGDWEKKGIAIDF